jgi:hypothetical protein
MLSKDGSVETTARAMDRAAPIARAAHALRDRSTRFATAHPALRVVVPLFICSRVVLVLATMLGAQVHLPSVLSQPTASPLWHTWFRWDAAYYATIAAHGYTLVAAHTTPAFFPLFPLAERLAAPFAHGDFAIAGLLIANSAWFVALCQIHALARADFSPAAAWGATLALTVFPTAFFGFVPYPEALFLALALASFRQMRRHCWLSAALLAALAALTRQAGLLLILPFLCEAIIPFGGFRGRSVFSVFRPLLASLLIPLATVGYALWLWHAVGDPLAFIHAQATWHRAFAWPWQTVWRGVGAVFSQPSRYFTLRAVQELLVVLGMGALCIPCVRRAPASYALFAVPLYLLFLSQPAAAWPLLSQSRLMLECFPLIIILGDIIVRHPWRAWLLVACCLPIQIAGIIIFSRAGWFI